MLIVKTSNDKLLEGSFWTNQCRNKASSTQPLKEEALSTIKTSNQAAYKTKKGIILQHPSPGKTSLLPNYLQHLLLQCTLPLSVRMILAQPCAPHVCRDGLVKAAACKRAKMYFAQSHVQHGDEALLP